MTPEAKEKLRAKAKAQWTPEARKAQSERLKAVKAKGAGKPSSSPPSQSSPGSSLPPVLPPTATPETSQASAQTLFESLLKKIQETTTPTTEPTDERPELPDDNAEREAALRPARWPARVPVVAVNEVCRVLKLDELSDAEREEGINAWAVLFWQWGLFKDGRVLVFLWLFGIAAPRATSAMLAAQERKKLTQGKVA
jgi:hypothetical protein